MTIDDLLNIAVSKTCSNSDWDLAKKTGIHYNTLNGYRNGKFPDDEKALQLAQITGLDSGFVLALCHAWRTNDPLVKKAWEQVATRQNSQAA